MQVHRSDYELDYCLNDEVNDQLNEQLNSQLNEQQREQLNEQQREQLSAQLNAQLNNKLNADNTQPLTEHYSNARVGWTSYGVLHFLAFIFAVYLAFKCNPNISVLSVLVAIFCPWIYIIYILVTRRGICSDVTPNNPMNLDLV